MKPPAERKDRDIRPEPRKACKWGCIMLSHGRLDEVQCLLGPCLCNTWATCGYCGEPHVWLTQCEVCASRRPEVTA